MIILVDGTRGLGCRRTGGCLRRRDGRGASALRRRARVEHEALQLLVEDDVFDEVLHEPPVQLVPDLLSPRFRAGPPRVCWGWGKGRSSMDPE